MFKKMTCANYDLESNIRLVPDVELTTPPKLTEVAMASTRNAGAGVSVNSTNEWVVFTGKLPQVIKKKLKLASAEVGRKQQEIVAEALEAWLAKNGL
ncbi:hypothetical protein D7B12_17700 [Salmonella enterica]|nr:hypothetical protein [Salmonella enterica]